MGVQNYRELVAWQKAMDLAVEVYQLTQRFPASELYGLGKQLRRAAVSVPSNIAEGQARGSGQAFVHYLRIAKGSLQEMETQIQLAERLNLTTGAQTAFLDRSCEVARLIAGLIRSIGS